MTDYTATCRLDADDIIHARRTDDDVFLCPTGVSVYLAPADARTFARGILALADEIDGGEATPAAGPKIGDRVRVVEDDEYNRPGEFVGKVGILTHTERSGRVPYGVQFGDGSGHHGDAVNGEWYVAEVEVVTDPAPTDATIRVGDRVTITQFRPYLHDAAGTYEGRTGTVIRIDTDDLPYMVRLDAADGAEVWVKAVRKFSPDATSPDVPANPRVALLDEARKYAGEYADAAEVVAVARFLAGE